MLDSQGLKRLADRCYSASLKCFDLSAATELRVIGDELSAKAIELQRRSLETAASSMRTQTDTP